MSSVTTVREDGVVTLLFGTPVLARRVLSEIAAVLDGLELESTPPPLVLASAHQTIFLAGADLREIQALDHATCIAYARLGRGVGDRLARYPAPVVAAVDGSCSGGGFDLVLACDAVVASARATFSHPGVRRGLVTGWGGSTLLDRAMGASATRRALLEGTDLDASELSRFGVVTSVAEDPRAEACDTARRIGRLHPSRLGLWRLLRDSVFVDRFRAFVVEKS
jgi:enoyl-CoA hydratase/carnithine racemase